MGSSALERPATAVTPFDVVRFVVFFAVILIEIAGVFLILVTGDVPDLVVLLGTATTAIIIGGSAAVVASRRRFGFEPSDEKSVLTRVTELVVSVTVLTGVTVVLGSVGGLVLTIIANMGGPDPRTDNDELLRDRLLDWVKRNRDFMERNGQGTLPLKP